MGIILKSSRFFLFFWVVIASSQSRIDEVNVFIGTDGTGHTFPGPSMPFGMVQPGPDNKDFGWNHTSGYQYKDTLLLGFSQTRLSGTGINEMGDVLVLPIHTPKKGLANSYDKASEQGRVGYYALTKKDGVKVELSCTERVAFHQYTFPTEQATVYVDLQHGLRFVFDEKNPKKYLVSNRIQIENNTTISGYCSTENWVNRTYFFTLTFDQPFINFDALKSEGNAEATRFLLDFHLTKNKVLKIKIALSTVDVEGAKNNMQKEIPHWDFDQIVAKNQQAWEGYLNRITIEAPSKQREIFYTSFYHLLLQPANIADEDGRYRGVDNSIALAPNKAYYSTLSIWDIYRGAFPLLQLVAPEIIDGIAHTMLVLHKSKGFLPIWTVWGQDNYCMIGNHAIPMLLSTYINGFRGNDAHEILNAMLETSTQSHINSDWEIYNQFGYYPFDKLDNESVSRTLESGYDDWCVASMATLLGETKIATQFAKRAKYYENLYDVQSTFFRGKDSKENWRFPFNPLEATSPLNNPGDYTEANAWQYFWTPAQHDVTGVIQLLGGRDNFTKKLNDFFTTEALNPNKFLGQEAMIGQYAHGNEPSHHVIYLYAWSNEPLKGQRYLKKVIDDFHNNTPDGMIGNDDCGQMSAWYILTSLGFYPVNPASGEFVLGCPQLKKAVLHLPNQKQFIIEGQSFSDQNRFSKSRKLNGIAWDKPSLTFQDIYQGGILQFEMTAQ
jgi:predicted alpha-1,2-mannosidase